MGIFWLMTAAPAAGGVLCGVLVWLLRRAPGVQLPRSVRVTTILGVGGMMLLVVAQKVSPILVLFTDGQWVFTFADERRPYAFAWLLLLGIVTTVVISLPGRRATIGQGAELAPRTATSIVGRWGLIIPVALAATAAGIALAVGSATETLDGDPVLCFSAGSADGCTVIYGWPHTVPSLIALPLLLLVGWLCVRAIARPAWGGDVAAERAARRVRGMNVVRTVAGALLLHLQVVLNDLASSAAMTISDAVVVVGTSFAAMETPLRVAATVCAITAFALWTYAILAVLPTKRSARATADAP